MLSRMVGVHFSQEQHSRSEERLQRYAALDLGAIEVIDEHCKIAEQLLRQKERKDSFYELEIVRKKIIADYCTNVLQPLEDKARRRGKQNSALPRREARAARKELSSAMSFSRDFTEVDILKRLYNSASAMVTYKRLTSKLHREIQSINRQAQRKRREHEEAVAKLNHDIGIAMRMRWCKRQTERWEPERHPARDLKELALEAKGGIPKISPNNAHDADGSPSLFLRQVSAINERSRQANSQRIVKDIIVV